MALRRRGSRGRRGHELFPGFADVYEIGVGSLAVVFRAREIGTNRQVALKLLNVRDASPRSIESFERESIALGALSSHPNIVTLYRTFRTPDGRPVLVLELCSGAVADRLRNGGAVPVADVVSIGVKIAGALETAHRGGILHRDVKPQNILVTEFGEPALADFGVAMLQSSTQTTAGLFDFTTLHAAPELLEGSGTSAATDVYELASSLYQLIAGQSAFRAYEGESPASVILRILRDPVRPLSGVDVPMALSDLLIRAMSKEKDERPPTAAEFAAELAEVEIAQGWNRTQFLIRDPGPPGTGVSPAITRMPDAVPRGLPSALAPSGPTSHLTHVGPAMGYPPPAPVQHSTPIWTAPPRPPTAPAVPPVRGPEPAAAAWSAPTIVSTGGWTPPPPAIRQPVPQQPPHIGDGGWSTPTQVAPASRPSAADPASSWREPASADGWWSPPPPQRSAHPSPLGQTTPEPAIPEPAAPAGAETWAPQRTPPLAPPTLAPPPLGPRQPDAPQADVPQADAPQPVRVQAEPPPAASPTPAPADPPRSRRIPIEIDDEFLPHAGPGRPAYTPRHDPTAQPQPDAGAPVESQTVPTDVPTEVTAHAAAEINAPTPEYAVPAAVPVWAVRAPAPVPAPVPSGPQFISDLSLDPMSLRPRATLRAGASAVTIDEQAVRLRTWFKRTEVAWRDVHGFEAHLDLPGGGAAQTPAVSGHIVALTALGPVQLLGTRRPLGELRYVHALLDAYRIRAQRIANSDSRDLPGR